MILIVNVCSDRLSYFEFVKPVEDIVNKAGMEFLTQGFRSVNHSGVNQAERVVICGTALNDFEYLNDVDKFEWITKSDVPILGICAGMQVLARAFNSDIVRRTRIGTYRVKVVQESGLLAKVEFHSYFLNSRAVKLNEDFETLGKSGSLECIVRHKRRELYGCLFHPEVLNPEIIINFLRQ